MRKGMYFAPAIFGLVFYGLLAVLGGIGAIHPAVWLCIVLLFVSAILMAQKKWFGCIPGILVGAVLVWMSFRSTGQAIDIERPLGAALMLFYILSSLFFEKRNRETRITPYWKKPWTFRYLMLTQ